MEPKYAPELGPRRGTGRWRLHLWPYFLGTLLVLVGIYYILRSAGLLGWVHDDVFWPIVAVLLGVFIILSRALHPPEPS